MSGTIDIDGITRLYGKSRRSAQIRLRQLEAAGEIRPVKIGGGRGNKKLYDAKTIRRLFPTAT
jgi:hypothetical protein